MNQVFVNLSWTSRKDNTRKKYMLFLSVYLLTIAACAQEKYTVPVPTDLQKFQLAAIQWNSSCLMQINYAKSIEKPVSDVARFTGDQLKGT